MGTFTTHNSWGRTRSPKNLAGENGTEITVLANTNDLVGITASTAGYATENQRYLHVLVEDATTSDDPGAVTIFGYCHAFNRWFEISGAQERSDHVGGDETNAAPVALVCTCGRLPVFPVGVEVLTVKRSHTHALTSWFGSSFSSQLRDAARRIAPLLA